MDSIHKRLALPLIILFFPVIFSCHKEQGAQAGSETRQLGVIADRIVKTGQELLVYDSTSFGGDSLTYLIPPANRIYEWTISGDAAQHSLEGYFKNGVAGLIFTSPGSYSASATIYDSASHRSVGHTDTVVITVLPDSLRAYQLVDEDDQLVFKPMIDSYLYYSKDSAYFGITWQTSRSYDFYDNYSYGLKPYFGYSQQGYQVAISDTIWLPTYPMVWSDPTEKPVLNGGHFDILAFGDSANIDYTWKGHTHHGVFTLIDRQTCTLVWND